MIVGRGNRLKNRFDKDREADRRERRQAAN